MRATTLAYVRTSGGTVKLHEGDTVPAEADDTHVAQLVERGVLTEAEKPQGKPRGGKPGGDNADT